MFTIDTTTTASIALTSGCVHCGRDIVLEDDTWIDPQATGDDAMWRETCDANEDSFPAEHEPADDDGGTPEPWSDSHHGIAMCVKVYGIGSRDVDPDVFDHAFQLTQEDWWREAEAIAKEFGFSGVCSAGRSDGWLQVFGADDRPIDRDWLIDASAGERASRRVRLAALGHQLASLLEAAGPMIDDAIDQLLQPVCGSCGGRTEVVLLTVDGAPYCSDRCALGAAIERNDRAAQLEESAGRIFSALRDHRLAAA